MVSTSWGGPSVFPGPYEAGVRNLRELLGFEVIESRTTRMAPGDLAREPRLRAETLNELFADDAIRGIFTTIGGDDSIRILPYLDTGLAASRPKVFMGFSDTATQLVAYHLAGLVTFNGPSVMAGLAQIRRFPEAAAHVRSMLFGEADRGPFEAYPGWVDRYADWSSIEGSTGIGPVHEHDGWHWLNGQRVATGPLFGGCIETLELLKGTPWWPTGSPEWWHDRVLFLETSEDKPSPSLVRGWLRNYGAQGAFDQLAGLWFGRARDYSVQEKVELDRVIVDVAVGEFGAVDLPIVSNLDFGHTSPQWVLPLGLRVQTDPVARTLRWLESPTD